MSVSDPSFLGSRVNNKLFFIAVNISYVWNFGSLLAVCIGTQIVTGVILAMHYTPNRDLAFVS